MKQSEKSDECKEIEFNSLFFVSQLTFLSIDVEIEVKKNPSRTEESSQISFL